MQRALTLILSALAFPAPASFAQSKHVTPGSRSAIVCFGDSITAGYGIDDRTRNYPADLQRSLDAEGFHYQVINAGVSGNTTKDALDRLPRILASHPAIVVLEFGGNDGLRGLPLEQTKANLAQLIQKLRAAHITVLLAGITLPPEYGAAYISTFNAMFPALAKQFHVPLLPMIMTGLNASTLQDDGVHPTPQGAVIVARNVEQALKPLLKK